MQTVEDVLSQELSTIFVDIWVETFCRYWCYDLARAKRGFSLGAKDRLCSACVPRVMLYGSES